MFRYGRYLLIDLDDRLVVDFFDDFSCADKFSDDYKKFCGHALIIIDQSLADKIDFN